MTRSHWVMFGLIVLLGSVYGYQQYRNVIEVRQEEDNRRLFPELKAGVVDTLDIYSLSGKHQVFYRKGRRWFAVSRVLLDGDKIQEFADGLALMQWERKLTDGATDEELIRYGLTKPLYKLKIGTHHNQYTLSIGERTPTGSSVYMRRGSDGDVVVAEFGFFDLLEKPLEELRERHVLPVNPGEIKSVSVRWGELNLRVEEVGNTSFSPKQEERWSFTEPVRRAAASGKIKDYLWKWRSLKVGRFLKDSEGVGWEKPWLRLEISTDYEQKTVLEVGPSVPVKPEMRYVRRVSPVETMVVDFTGNEDLLHPKLSDFENRYIYEFEVDSITRLEIKVRGHEVIARRRKGWWEIVRPKAVKLEQRQVDAVVSNLLWRLKDLEWVQQNTGKFTPEGDICLYQGARCLVRYRIGEIVGGESSLSVEKRGKSKRYRVEGRSVRSLWQLLKPLMRGVPLARRTSWVADGC